MSDRPDLDRLWDDVPVGRPDLDAALRGGTRIRRRRQTVGAVVTTAVLVLGIGTGTALWPRPDEVPSPAPAVPSPPSADGATLYYLLDEPVPEDPSFEPATLLTSREVVVEDTGRPGYDALHALLTLEPPVAGLTEGLNVLDQPGEEPTIDVRSVTHDDGVVRVELTGTPWDPYPSVDFCCPPNGEVVTQQLVHTVQAALGTTDPVEFDSRGIWFDRLDGPVEADPDLVVPPTGVSAVEEVPLPTGPTGPGEEELVGTLGLDADGCVVVERGSLPAPLLLPIGWTAWLVSGELVLLDDRGALAARGGQSVRIAYGYGKVDRGPCGGPDQVRVDLLSIRYGGMVSGMTETSHEHGYLAHDDKDKVLKRLRRIEGQVRGIHRMVEEEKYCIDVLTQVSAATKALESVALTLLHDHLTHCVVDAAREGGPEADRKVREASDAIARLVRS